ncbi:Arc family DNA-binding protein [Paracoccus sp. SSJ]|uniref:Arc family DNA-binding protein n=1 Tax=Paracoccus sp. SSJ TaxID=3050636 RepID=UPI00254B206E|nr:Arc family DNA-binding protein [Paracoccus sp. SSJ]MDK8874413.1 Arc family DNA-binding protein [Paracoccus sp. SSJ]
MAKQDDWARITLRLPRELHEKLNIALDETNRSMNAEIVARLTESLERDDLMRTPAPGGGLFGMRPRSPEVNEFASEVARILAEELAKTERK